MSDYDLTTYKSFIFKNSSIKYYHMQKRGNMKTIYDESPSSCYYAAPLTPSLLPIFLCPSPPTGNFERKKL
jgi:hypothetical protein